VFGTIAEECKIAIMAELSADPNYIVIRIRRPPFIATLAIAQLLTALVFSRDGHGEWRDVVGLGILYTQPFLFAEWLVLGCGQFASRVQWTLFTFAVALAIPSHFPGSDVFNPGDLLIRMTQFAAMLAVATAAKQVTGWRLAREHEVQDNTGASFRFNIKSLLLWTTSWAVYLAVVRFVMGTDGTRSIDWPDVLLGLGLFSLFLAPLALWAAALLTVNAFGRPFLLALAVWIPSSIGANIWLRHLGDNDLLLWLLITFGGLLSISLAMIPLRLAGYRLRRVTLAPSAAL
jgi:hypothetical protein